MDREYRQRIYTHYVEGRAQSLAPSTLAGLAPRMPYLRKLVREHFPAPRDAEVLDVGCGHGAIMYAARQAGYLNVRGVDGSPEQVEAARKLGIPGVTQGDLLGTLKGQADGSLDVVVAFDVIEHFTKDELLVVVDEVLRVLKPSGRWIIHTVNACSPFGGVGRYGDLTHELAFTPTSIAQLIFSSGFVSLCSFDDTPVPHGFKSAVRWLLWRMIRKMLSLYIAVETGMTDARIFTQHFLTVAIK